MSLTLALEALHLSLPSSDGKLGVFHPVVGAQSAGLVEMLAAQNLHRRPVRGKPIGHDPLG